MTKIKNQMVVYQAKTGAIELKGDFKKETLWATQAQIAEVFGVERSVITKHIRNILKDKELAVNSVCAKSAHTAPDSKTYEVQFYNLDLILAVGYRTNSARAITFRQWATKTLRDHITKGFTINRSQIKNNYSEFMKVVENLKVLLPPDGVVDQKSVLELINAFSATWLSIDAYDKDRLATTGTTKRAVNLTTEHLMKALIDFKVALTKRGEASELFGVERQKNNIQGIVGNVMQSFGGRPMYPTIEEKAAHLLYFMIKNHPFIDGNKRSGAYAFIWFLKKTGIFNLAAMSPAALTALTLLVAESEPKNKERMIKITLQLLR